MDIGRDRAADGDLARAGGCHKPTELGQCYLHRGPVHMTELRKVEQSIETGHIERRHDVGNRGTVSEHVAQPGYG